MLAVDDPSSICSAIFKASSTCAGNVQRPAVRLDQGDVAVLACLQQHLIAGTHALVRNDPCHRWFT
jgi:hypothetical protein